MSPYERASRSSSAPPGDIADRTRSAAPGCFLSWGSTLRVRISDGALLPVALGERAGLECDRHCIRECGDDRVRPHRSRRPPEDVDHGCRLSDHRAVLGPVALYQYFKRGRAASAPAPARICQSDSAPGFERRATPKLDRMGWWTISKAASHCGAGCTIGDIVGEWVVWATGISLARMALPVDALLASRSRGASASSFSTVRSRRCARCEG